MIITSFGIIVFHLVERIALTKKISTEVLENGLVMLGFSFNAILSRHEVHMMPYQQDIHELYKIITFEKMNPKNYKRMLVRRINYTIFTAADCLKFCRWYKGLLLRWSERPPHKRVVAGSSPARPIDLLKCCLRCGP